MAIKIISKTLMTKISHISWGVTTKAFTVNGVWFGEGFGAFDEDSNHDLKIEKEKLVSIVGIEPTIIPAWEEII